MVATSKQSISLQFKMNYLILIIPLLTIAYLFAVTFSGFISVGAIHGKLWSNIEGQLEELKENQEVQKLKINELQELLRKNGINYTQQEPLSDENDDDPFSFKLISNIQNDLALLKYYYTRGKTASDPKQAQLELSRQLSQISAAEYSTNNHTEEYCTVGGGDYKFINITGATGFNVKLRVPSDAKIAFAYQPFEVQPMYEIILGRSTNTETVIRKNSAVVARISHGRLLKDCEFMGFWIRWNDGVLRLGYEANTESLIHYNATDLYKVNYIGLQTAYAVGNWIIY